MPQGIGYPEAPNPFGTAPDLLGGSAAPQPGGVFGPDIMPKQPLGAMRQGELPWWLAPIMTALGARGMRRGGGAGNVLPFPPNPATARMTQPASQQELSTLRDFARSPPRDVGEGTRTPAPRREAEVVPLRGTPGGYGTGRAPWEGSPSPATVAPQGGGHVAGLARLSPRQMEVFHSMRRQGKTPAEALAAAQGQSE